MDTTQIEEEKPDLQTRMQKLVAEKKTAFTYQKRKHDDWNENYELYRNKVRVNRLTQRQSTAIPLTKETVKSALATVDDAPNTDWNEKGGDEQKEIVFQEIWNDMSQKGKLEVKDVLDKKNVLIYGISTKLLNLGENYATIDVLDPFDVLYDPLMSPLNVETARYIIHQNIFKPLRDVLADDKYTEAGKNELRAWASSSLGLVQSNENAEALRKKEARLKAMGTTSPYFAQFAGGETIVNLTAHYTNEWNKDKQIFERHVVVQAQDLYELSNRLLKDAIGIEEWPFEPWSEDIETVDIYPDSVADLVRPINKVINAWFSQLVENRTLRNFNMHWYDSTVQGYQPQTYEPGQGRMLPAPGDPNKTIMPVNVDGLEGTMEAIQFLTGIAERGSGVTAISKGTPEGGQQTLGEVQILVGKAQERAISMKVFYRTSWYQTAVKWGKIQQANSWPALVLHKAGTSGKVYKKTITDKDWKSEAGYEPKISSSSEQEENTVKSIQKWGYIKSQFPNNSAVKRIAQKRELGLVDVTAQELQEIEAEEERIHKMEMAAMAAASMGGAPGQPVQPGAPGQPQPAPGAPQAPMIDPALASQLQSKLGQLQP